MNDHPILYVMLATNPVFLLGVAILMATRLVTGPSPGDRKSVFVTGTRTFAWILTGWGFLVGMGMILPIGATTWLASVAVIISMAYSKHVATQRYAMLALVGAAAERSAPLAAAFAAFGRERGGWMRRRAAEIASMLYHGASLPDAVHAVPGVLPPETVPLLCVGHENGSLAPAIRQAIAARNLYEPVWQSIVPKIGYVCMLPTVAVGVFVFLALKIIPQFEKIFKDFNTRMPDVHTCSIHRGPVAASLAAAVHAVAVPGGAVRLLRAPLCGLDPLGLAGDGLAHAAAAYRHGAGHDRAGCPTAAPLSGALATLASFYPQRSIERRLWAVCDDVEAGGDDLQSLYRHGLLGKADLALLQSAQRNGNLAWAAREMADSNRRRFIYRLHAAVQVIFPLVIVGYGLVVAAIAVAMLLPLAHLIWRLTPA